MSIQYPLNNFNNRRLIVACAINRADKPLTSYFGLHTNANNSYSVAFKYLFWILDYFISYQDKSQAVLYSDGAFTHFLCGVINFPLPCIISILKCLVSL